MNLNVYSFSVQLADGTTVALSPYRGRVALVVNTASRCGYATQLSELEGLYRKYKDRGFVVLAFPCDQFHHREPGTDAEILRFYKQSLNLTFPIFAKIKVNGPGAPLLFQYLTMEEGFDLDSDRSDEADRLYAEMDPGYLFSPDIKWNFTKFLINQKGKVLRRYEPGITPNLIDTDIQSALCRQRKTRKERATQSASGVACEVTRENLKENHYEKEDT